MSDFSVPAMPKLSLGLAKDESEGLSTRFKVIVPGMRELTFKSCEGMESEVEVLTFFEGGRLGPARTGRGRQHVGRVAFAQGSASTGSGGRSVFDWYMDVADGSKPLEKKTLSVLVTDAEGRDLAEWRVKNAWPCRWVAPLMSTENTQLTVEYVSFAHEGVERKK
jgi:phage tail-like protein